MTVNGGSDVEARLDKLIDFRRDIHAHPELAYKEYRTAGKISAELANLGLEVHQGIGGTGIVASLSCGNSARCVGLRADMDALPLQEETGLPYASKSDGVFHGCGHDGHVAMLLGTAQQLVKNRDFDGTVRFIFQPAEEGQGGAKAMIEDGLFQRFPCDRIYALHNWPDLPLGTIATRPGPIMAAADRFEISVLGQGGHAAMPHVSPDAILAACELTTQLNTIVSRKINPSSNAVLSVTRIEGGKSHNVIPAKVILSGTVRTFELGVQDAIEATIHQMAEGVALASGTQIKVDYYRYYPATINSAEAAQNALEAAATVGIAIQAPEAAFTSEDFGFMLQHCEGAYIWLGQASSKNTRPLHHPCYDFNDDALGIGINLSIALIRNYLSEQIDVSGLLR